MIEMTLEMAEKAVKAAQAKAKELGRRSPSPWSTRPAASCCARAVTAPDS